MTSAIQTEGLTKDYGQHQGVFELNLEVHRGRGFRLYRAEWSR